MKVRFLLLGLMDLVGPGVAQRPHEKFKLFKFKNDKTDIYSLSIKCNEENERFFERLFEVVAKESRRLVPKVNGRKLKPEEFELVKDIKVGRNTYAKIYTRKSGKVKCCVSLKSPKEIPINELEEENFEEEEILVKKMDIMESYFDDLSDESDEED